MIGLVVTPMAPVPDRGDGEQAEPEEHQGTGLGQHDRVAVRTRQHKTRMNGTGSRARTCEPGTSSA